MIPPQGIVTPVQPGEGDVLFQSLLLRIGKLNYVWTNTESLLIHLIAGLAEMEKDPAVVVFLTLNTTRARLDLVERLAKLPKTSATTRDAVLALMQRFQKEAPLRNKYNHCIYSFDPEMGTVRTIMMRISDRKTDMRIGKAENADQNELMAIDNAIGRLESLNRDIWQFIAKAGYPT